MTTACAPGKVILFGEHAVVYGRPAIAVPLCEVEARAEVDELPGAGPGRIRIEAPNVGRAFWLHEAGQEDPLALAVHLALGDPVPPESPALRIRISSTIPVASGLGSGAAVTVALLRALSAHGGRPLAPDRLSALAFEVERLHHGNPSGIDNTVIVYERPVYFRRGHPIESLTVTRPIVLVIAFSGKPSPTATAVAKVRERWQADAHAVEVLFDSIGLLVDRARRLLEGGQTASLGPLMDENHALLSRLGVSTPALDGLVAAARAAGATGAKLSGGGLGGNIIAAAEPDRAEAIASALRAAGAVQTLVTQVNP